MRGNFKHSNIDGCILHQVQREREGRKPRNHGSKNSNLTSSTPPEIEHTTSRCPSYGDVVPNENKWPTSRKSVRRLLSVCAAVGVHFIESLWDWNFQAAKPIVFFNFYVSFSLKISEFAASKVTRRHQSTRVSCEWGPKKHKRDSGKTSMRNE